MTRELAQRFPLEQEIIGEQNQKDFISLFGAILRLKNILTAFDAFTGNEILSERDMQDYQSIYLDLYQQMKPDKSEKENINDDIVFEIELIRQVEINIDYILMLVQKYHDGNCKDKEILVTIDKACLLYTSRHRSTPFLFSILKESMKVSAVQPIRSG